MMQTISIALGVIHYFQVQPCMSDRGDAVKTVLNNIFCACSGNDVSLMDYEYCEQ